ncbi:hypothetical protein MFRU_016g01240 [Monilinia fructicola]|uniref:Uncharacterized protein n=1 Tax=Monilinia fructicola TaxID=38448 RepID=A0A5M9JUR8_MONFR|nr:hypothetical protein EYC84_001621 [Monilinia fructicola]KAG4029371.1 hypothetical protein MFRU_016g01240 [Monilinia fructicola]
MAMKEKPIQRKWARTLYRDFILRTDGHSKKPSGRAESSSGWLPRKVEMGFITQDIIAILHHRFFYTNSVASDRTKNISYRHLAPQIIIAELGYHRDPNIEKYLMSTRLF